MEGLKTTSYNFFEVASNYSFLIVIAAIIVCGILFVIGGQNGRERAKSSIPWILLGACLIIGGVSLGEFIVSKIQF